MIRWKREGTIVKFCDRLLQLRRARKLTQKDVAAACGITRQTYSGYESGERYPKKKEMYQVLADFFEVDVAYLYTDREMFLDAAHEQYGSRGMAQARELVSQLAGMFAGGELSDQDREAVMRSLEKAYWLAKEAKLMGKSFEQYAAADDVEADKADEHELVESWLSKRSAAIAAEGVA